MTFVSWKRIDKKNCQTKCNKYKDINKIGQKKKQYLPLNLSYTYSTYVLR